MRVLIACEFSGRVRDAFIARGHDAVSCDLEPSETPGPHIQGDVYDALRSDDWEIVIAFPPCTYLCSSGARWWAQRQPEQKEAARFFRRFISSATAWAIENPIGFMSTAWRKPDQIIQPWQFGHAETKATCLWLGNLPKLVPTDIVPVEQRRDTLHRLPQTNNRSKIRSRTFPGIAAAMAAQWG